MSWWNWIDTEWTCPFCGAKQSGEIRFRYGGQQPALHVGNEIDWSGAPPAGLPWDPLPDDTGDIPSEVHCKNDWYSKWAISIGARVLGQVYWNAPDPSLEPSVEERKKLGCPRSMNIVVRIRYNKITGVFFSNDPTILDARW